MTIGKFLEQLRKEKGLTQAQVAEALGVSDRTISAWETGSRLPDVLALSDLAAFYGVTADEILHGRRSGAEPPASDETDEPEAHSEARDKRRSFSVQSMAAGGILSAALTAIFIGNFLAGTIFYYILLISGILTVIVTLGFLAALKSGADGVALPLRREQKLLTQRILFKALYIAAGVMGVLALIGLLLLGLPLPTLLVGGTAVLTIVYIVAAVTICLVGNILLHRGVVRLGGKEAVQVSTRNYKRVTRSILFGGIPVVLLFIFSIVCLNWYPQTKKLLYEAGKQDMIDYLQTVIVGEGYSIPAGRYVIDLSDVDLSVPNDKTFENGMYFAIRKDGDCTLTLGKEILYTVERQWVGDTPVYNFRFAENRAGGTKYIYEQRLVNDITKYEIGETSDGRYGVWEVHTYDISLLAGRILVFTAAGDALLCAIICLVKYKKVPIEIE